MNITYASLLILVELCLPLKELYICDMSAITNTVLTLLCMISIDRAHTSLSTLHTYIHTYMPSISYMRLIRYHRAMHCTSSNDIKLVVSIRNLSEDTCIQLDKNTQTRASLY